MDLVLGVEVVSYFGLLGLQVFWAMHHLLTERRFALLQVSSLSLILVTAILTYADPDYPFGMLAGVGAVGAFAVIGYPLARWAYRQFLER